jgi:hypothetical protein
MNVMSTTAAQRLRAAFGLRRLEAIGTFRVTARRRWLP